MAPTLATARADRRAFTSYTFRNAVGRWFVANDAECSALPDRRSGDDRRLRDDLRRVLDLIDAQHRERLIREIRDAGARERALLDEVQALRNKLAIAQADAEALRVWRDNRVRVDVRNGTPAP